MTAPSVVNKNASRVRLFIGNLIPTISNSALNASLSNFGSVTYLARNRERNFAHLYLTTKEEKDVEKCISVLNQTRWMGTVLRVEVAKEHFTTRLERERQVELNAVDVKAHVEDAVPRDNREVKVSFSWVGKRITFADHNNAHGNSPNNCGLIEDEPQVHQEEMPQSGKLAYTREAAAASDLFGLERATKHRTSKAMKPQGDAATVDLFGLQYEGDKQEPVIERRTSKRKRVQSKQSEESAQADRDAMYEIGSDPSKIDISREHDRARAIMAEMFGSTCGNNEVIEKVTITSKRKALYAHFMRGTIYSAVSNSRQSTAVESSELWVPSFGISAKVDCVHRRKSLYKNR